MQENGEESEMPANCLLQGTKKAHPQSQDELNPCTTESGASNLNADLSALVIAARMDVAPSAGMVSTRLGCQGFYGPFPSAFLDKYVKELAQMYGARVHFAKYCLAGNFLPVILTHL